MDRIWLFAIINFIIIKNAWCEVRRDDKVKIRGRYTRERRKIGITAPNKIIIIFSKRNSDDDFISTARKWVGIKNCLFNRRQWAPFSSNFTISFGHNCSISISFHRVHFHFHFGSMVLVRGVEFGKCEMCSVCFR